MTLFAADSGALDVQRTILSTTSTTVIRDAETSGEQSIAKILVCNKTGGVLTVDIEVYDGTTSWWLEFTRTVAVGASFELRDEVLHRGSSLRAKASGAGLHVSVIFALGARVR